MTLADSDSFQFPGTVTVTGRLDLHSASRAHLSVDDGVVEHGCLVVDLLGQPPDVHRALGDPLGDEGALDAGLQGILC